MVIWNKSTTLRYAKISNEKKKPEKQWFKLKSRTPNHQKILLFRKSKGKSKNVKGYLWYIYQKKTQIHDNLCMLLRKIQIMQL